MRFEKYDPETHAETVPEFFSDVVEAPENFESFRRETQQAFQDIREVLGMEAEFDVVIAEVDTQKLPEGTPEGLYFRGYSLGKEAHGHAERNALFVAASKESDYWEAGLKNMVVHEEAHQEFFDHISDLDHVVWESMILEGHALHREKLVREEKEYPWRGDPREYEGPADEVVAELDKNREWQGERYDRENVSSIFSMDSEWEGIGYVIAQEVYFDIISREEMDVDEPLEMSKEWLRNRVEESINQLYD